MSVVSNLFCRAGISLCALALVTAVVPVFADDSLPDALVVWSEPDGKDFDVWYSQVNNGRWVVPERITVFDEAYDVLPCAAALPDGRIVAVWTRFNSVSDNHLYFSIKSEDGWSEAKKIETGMSINMAANLVVDGSGVLWLGWAGFDGSDDDIYVARLEGDAWSPRRLVGKTDFTPDILPQLGINENGQPWVRWQGLGANGYSALESVFDGERFSEERLMTPDELEPENDVVSKRLDNLVELPKEVSDPGKSCITLFDDLDVQTIRVPRPELPEVPVGTPVTEPPE